MLKKYIIFLKFIQNLFRCQPSIHIVLYKFSFLTQLEAYDGVFIASTNLLGGLDQAALRRFDDKVEIDYLLPHQAEAMLRALLRQCHIDEGLARSSYEHLRTLHTLTPGDFALAARQHRITPFANVADVIGVRAAEVSAKQPPTSRPIGFVCDR